MQLARIVFAGALLFGVGCELSEEGELATDQRVYSTNLDDSINHESEGESYENQASNYATDESTVSDQDMLGSTADPASPIPGGDNCFHPSECSTRWAGKCGYWCDHRGFSHMTGDGCWWPKKKCCCINP